MSRPRANARSNSLDEADPIRLQRFLASTGVGSRRHCEEFIVAGRVSIDGVTVRDLGTRVDQQHQQVRFDGDLLHREPLRYFLINKPRGYLCTNQDPEGRPRAIDLVPAGRMRLFTVGRLDEGSEGLILVTNDGDLAHRLAHPRFQVPRTYIVQIAGRPVGETFETLKQGIHFHEGRFSLQWIRRTGTKGNSTFLEVGLSHGQNREIRRLFARVGHKVMRLRRVAFGPLRLGRLAEGQFRPLLGAELKALRELESFRRPRAPRPEKSHAVSNPVENKQSPADRPARRNRSNDRGRGRSTRRHD